MTVLMSTSAGSTLAAIEEMLLGLPGALELDPPVEPLGFWPPPNGNPPPNGFVFPVPPVAPPGVVVPVEPPPEGMVEPPEPLPGVVVLLLPLPPLETALWLLVLEVGCQM